MKDNTGVKIFMETIMINGNAIRIYSPSLFSQILCPILSIIYSNAPFRHPIGRYQK